MRILLFFTLLFALCSVNLMYKHCYKEPAYKELAKVNPNKPFIQNRPSTLQARASHMITILTQDGTAHCTGTAIGPHAILTAEHCSPEKRVRFDYATETYNVLLQIKDNREHIIFFIDGPPFTEIEPINLRAPRIGEVTYFYGHGNKVYPATAKMGIVLDEYDPSEIDAREGLFYISNLVLLGDSGAVVYGSDGDILGVVTYRLTDGMSDLISHGGIFPLAFTRCQIKMAQNYVHK